MMMMMYDVVVMVMMFIIIIFDCRHAEVTVVTQSPTFGAMSATSPSSFRLIHLNKLFCVQPLKTKMIFHIDKFYQDRGLNVDKFSDKRIS